MKILIFDDNKRDREHLTNCLKTFFKNKDISYQITICQNTDELLNDMGTMLIGEQAVECGLIDKVGGIKEALAKLNELIKEKEEEK